MQPMIEGPPEKSGGFFVREEDPKKNTQARVAALLGVTRQAVAKWSEPNATGCNGFKPKPDARVVVLRTQGRRRTGINAGRAKRRTPINWTARSKVTYHPANQNASQAVFRARLLDKRA